MKYKIFYYMILMFFLALLTKIPTYAAEKELNVELPKGAGVAIFNFDFETDQDYEVIITLPSGESVSQPISGPSGTVTILDSQAGNYNVMIRADEEISVKARVEIKNSMSTALIESGVTISSAITGLSLYFIDGSIAGKWDDTNLGKVNITVTNPRNMQILHNVTVEENSFALALSDDIQEIEVYLIPASSSKISGAGVTYTLPVIRNLDAQIRLPEKNITNMDTAIIEATLGDIFTIEVVENNITVYCEELSLGNHEIEFPLNAIDNSITVYVRDEKGNTSTYTCQINKDIIAPTLKLSDSYDKITTVREEIAISGVAGEADFLFVNGEEVELASNGKFSFTCGLDVGSNEFTICAMDIAGNECIIKVNIERVQNSSITAPLIYFITIIFVFLLIIGLAYKKRHNQEKQKLNVDEETGGERKKRNYKKNLQNESFVLEVAEHIKKKRNKMIFVTIGNTLVAIAGIYVLSHICFFGTYVGSGSMEPTLETGSIVIYNKIYYLTHGYNRGDIVCLWSDTYGNYIAKRIIGLPGDEIEFHDGKLFINGCICQEEYIPDGVETNSLKSFHVPEGHVFILGDNREFSIDSRYWNDPYIDIGDIVGKYFGTIENPLSH